MGFLLITERLYVTEFTDGMAESVHVNSLDEDNRIFLPDEVFETTAEAESTIAELISFYSRDAAPKVYPVLLHDKRQIGHVQAVPLSAGWEIGYHIAKDFTGCGYATEAVRAFLPFILEHLCLQEITGFCHAENAASRRVLEKCGFMQTFEGIGAYHGQKQPVCRYMYTL